MPPFQVSATDKDAGPNGTVTYNVTSDYFTIDSSTGRITSRKVLDREAVAKHTVIVSALDGGSPAKVSKIFKYGRKLFMKRTRHNFNGYNFHILRLFHSVPERFNTLM